MKNLFTLLFALSTGLAFSQCPPGSVILSTQSEVDDFVANFPDCTEINGNLTLGGAFFSSDDLPLDLSGLSNLNTVTGTLNIYTTSALDAEDNLTPGSLDGLENITSVRSLIVGLPAGNSGVGFPIAYESLDPLNSIEGQLDSLFLAGFAVEQALPPFENIEGIGYFRHQFVRGIESTPAFPALTYLGDLTITGQNLAEDTMATVIIPPLLTEISTNPDSFNWPNGGVFIFGAPGLMEVVGGENLTYIQTGSINNNLNLSDLSAFSNVSDIGQFGLSIESCNPEIFDSFQNLESVELDGAVRLDFGDPESCEGTDVESIDFMVSSGVSDPTEISYNLRIDAESVNSIAVSGNFSNLKSLRVTSLSASEITGFSSLDSIQGDLLINIPGITELPNFSDLVYIGGEFDMRLNFGDWQLENMAGMEALEFVGELSLGGAGPSGAAQFESLDGLESLTSAGEVNLRNLEVLNDLSALSNLESVVELSLRDLDGLTTPPTFSSLVEFNQIIIDATALTSMPLFPAAENVEGDLEIRDNEFLTTVDGFENLTLLNGELNVQGNSALTSIALPEDMLFGGPLTINDNPSLENCGLSASICNLVSQSFLSQIMNNGEGCMSLDNVMGMCLSSTENREGDSYFSVFTRFDELLIRSEKDLNNVVVAILSIEGKQLISQSMSLSAGDNILPLGGLSEGIYLVSLRSEEVAFSKKLFYAE